MVNLQNAAAFEAALAARQPQRIRIVFNEGTVDEVELGNDMVSATAGVNFHETVNSETNLTIGLCPSASVSFTIINDGSNQSVDLTGFEFGEAHIYLGVKLLNNTWQDVSMGYFEVERPDVVRKKLIEITAQDRMVKFDTDWPAGISITTSTTMRSLVSSMCTYLNVPLSSASFLNESVTVRQVPKDLSNKTMREVLSWVAEAAGSIARFNRDGQLEFFWYDTQNPVATIDESGYTEFSPAWFTTTAIDKLVIRNADSTDQYTAGSGDNVYVIQDNPFLRQSGSAATQTRSIRAMRDTPTTPESALYSRLSEAPTYHPYGVTTFLDWRYQAGDVLTITSDNDTFTEPIYNLDLTWNGDAITDLSATGDQDRPPLSPLRRREYTYGGGIAGAQKTAEDAVQYSTDFTVTDRGIGLLAQAVGVKIDSNTGLPSVDQQGNYEFDPDNGAALTSQINVTAGNIILKTGITSLSGNDTLYSLISAEANRIALVVSTDSQGNNKVNAASIVAEINSNTAGASQSNISLNADRIKIDATDGVYLNGVLFRSNSKNTLDVNIVKTGKLEVGSSESSGDTDIYGSVDFYGANTAVTFQNGFRIGSSSPYKTIDANFNPVVGITLTPPASGSNDYTLSYTDLGGTSHQVGTFSRAVSQFSGVWSGGNTLTVTASPQGQTYTEMLSYAISTTPSGGASSTTIDRFSSLHRNMLTISGSSQQSGAYIKQYTIDASSVYNDGWDDAEAKLDIPTTSPATITSVMTVKYPDRTKTTKQSSTTYTLSDDTTNHKVKLIYDNAVIAEQAYNPGSSATVTSVKLYSDAGGGVIEEVPSDNTVSSTMTVFPRANLSDNTHVDGSSYTFRPHSGSYVFGTETFTANGTYAASTYGYDGFSSVTVNVSGAPTLGSRTFTSNNTTYNASSYGLDGFSSVRVEVTIPTVTINTIQRTTQAGYDSAMAAGASNGPRMTGSGSYYVVELSDGTKYAAIIQ